MSWSAAPASHASRERTEVVLQFGIGGHDGKDLLVRLVEELDGMGEGAIPAVLVHPQKPDDGGKENGGRLNEEIALLRRPRPVEIEHDAVRTLVSIGDVGHELRVEGLQRWLREGSSKLMT